jgi:transposase
VSVHGTGVGLDVHAFPLVVHAVDEGTGQVARARICPDHGEIVRWLTELAVPVRVAYEAGPTGFGLARALCAAGIECVVAAPSKLVRPSGDRMSAQFRLKQCRTPFFRTAMLRWPSYLPPRRPDGNLGGCPEGSQHR